MREKRFEGLGSIGQFLSEGEQKAVALADFFAELSMQSERVPAVFDDPATSFDHERKELIAKRIALEAEKRQVIVFTHDLMFASYLHEQVEKDDGSIDRPRPRSTTSAKSVIMQVWLLKITIPALLSSTHL